MNKKFSTAVSALLIGFSVISGTAPSGAAVTIIQLATPTFATLDQKVITLKPPVSNSPGDWSVVIDNPAVANAVGLQVTLLSVGTTVIEYFQEASGGYTAASKHSRLTVTPGIPVLGEFKNQNVFLAQNTFTLNPPTSTSDGTWVFQSLNPEIATVSGRIVTLKDGGEVKIRATQNVTNKWTSASAEMILNVSAPAPVIGSFSDITLSIDSVSKVQLTYPTSTSKGSWALTSSDPSIVAIEGSSIIAKKAGSVEITANQAPLGGFRSATAKMKVTISAVNPSISAGDFKNATVELDAGATKTLILKAPVSNSSGAWTFTSSNPSVATISGAVLTALKPGTIQVTASQASAGNYAAVNLSPITIKVLGRQNLVAPMSISKLVGDPSVKIIFPASASNGAWTSKSSNPDVVNVVENNLNFVGAGKATISLTQAETDSYLGNTVNFDVTVIGLPPTLGTFSALQVGVGESLQTLTLPTSNSKGKWVLSSSDPTIAVVNNGVITGIKAGATIISAYQEPLGKYGQSSTLQASIVVKPQPTVANFQNIEIMLGLPAKSITPPASNSSAVWVYSSSAPGVVSLNGSLLVPVSAGSAVITAQQLPNTQFTGATKTFAVIVKPAPLPKASASLAGRVISIYLSNPLNSTVSVKINSASGKVGKNSVLPGNRVVVVKVGGKTILTKAFSVR